MKPLALCLRDYTSIIGVLYRIIWQGTYENEVHNETSYVFAQQNRRVSPSSLDQNGQKRQITGYFMRYKGRLYYA